MRLRRAPTAATWFLKLFCSIPEPDSVIGDLLEQYQRGRGRFWYWRQVIGIVVLGLYRKVRRVLDSPNRIPMRQGLALILLIAVLAAVLLSDIWLLGLVGILGGIITGSLKLWRGNGRTEPANSDANDAPTYHRGISIHHIPVEGAVGLLFVFATVSIFGVGIASVREMLVVTIPLGIFLSGILIYWHRYHPVKIQALDLHKQK